MIKNMVLQKSKNKKQLLAFLLAIVLLSFGCVLPGIQVNNSNSNGEIDRGNFSITEQASTESNSEIRDCSTLPVKVLAIVLADPSGGLNLRDNKLENNGKIIGTLMKNQEVDVIFHDDGWDYVRVEYDTCGYVNAKYLMYLEKPSE